MNANDLLNRLYIVNDVDRPYERCVALLGDDDKLRYLYIDWPAMPRTGRETALADFGFNAIELKVLDKPPEEWRILLDKGRRETARYPDGAPRYWQGQPSFVLEPEVIRSAFEHGRQPVDSPEASSGCDLDGPVREWASAERGDDDVQIDDEKPISYGNDGAWVPAWVFVPRSVYDQQEDADHD